MYLMQRIVRWGLFTAIISCVFFAGVVFADAAGEGRIIVKFKSDAPSVMAENAGVVSEFSLREKKELRQIRVKVFSTPAGTNVQDTLKRLRAKTNVEYAEEDVVLSIAKHSATKVSDTKGLATPGGQSAAFIPNDPFYGSSWHHQKIESPSAWDYGSGAGVVIAILDTGVNCAEADLAGKCVAGWNTYNNTGNTDDDYGHGTMVAGTAAAIGNNSIQVTGVAYGATIMPLKINISGKGSAYTSDIAEAILWAADHNAKVANLSFGSLAGPTITMKNAAGYLRGKGGVLFQSAGNDGLPVTYPDAATITTVGATDQNDFKASFSNTGVAVDLSAPGVGILTVGRDGLTYSVSGTSFSSPILAGVAALMLARNPALLPWQLENLIFANSVDLGASGKDTSFGWGRVNAAAAVQNAFATPPPDTTPPDAPLISSWSYSTSVNLWWTSSYDNTGPVFGYRVYRNGVQIASLPGTQTTYTDTNPGAGTWTYTLKATDAAGLLSVASAGITVTTSGGTGAPTCTLSASPSSITAGASSTLSWTTTNATSVSINQGIGAVATSGSTSVSPSATTTYILTATGSGGTVTCNRTVTVTAPTPAPTCTLSASPSSVTSGDSSTLSWTTTDATSASINQGVGSVTPVASGSTSVAPGSTTTYTMTAMGAGGTITCTATVTVSDPPPPAPTCALSANPSSITTGDSSTLSWTSTNATSVSIDQGVGNVTPVAAGSVSVSPLSTTTYTLTATGSGGTVVCDTTVTVTTTPPPPPAPTCTLSANPSSITTGDFSTLSWTSTNATSVSIDQGIGSVATSGSQSVSPGGTTTYTLTATGAGGTVQCSKTVTVTSNPAPTCTLSASPSSITTGNSSTLSWTTANATSVSVDQGIGSVAASGSTTVSPSSTTTYTLTATGAGGSITCTATVTVTSSSLTISGISVTPQATFGVARAIFEWNTGTVPATGTVAYGTSPSALTNTVNASNLLTSQSVIARGLLRKTTYYYKITATAGAQIVQSVVLSFITP